MLNAEGAPIDSTSDSDTEPSDLVPATPTAASTIRDLLISVQANDTNGDDDIESTIFPTQSQRHALGEITLGSGYRN
jgi:hypothetical protein